jgi:hypothetical protein
VVVAAGLTFQKSGRKEAQAMPHHLTDQPLSLEKRKQVFLALVDAQDRRLTVAESRRITAEDFNLTEDEIRQIEEEGLNEEWPPLS